MPGNTARDEAWPELIEHWFFGRIVMHRVAFRYRNILIWGRLWLSVAVCGVMCRPPIAGYEATVTWCPDCYPDGHASWPIENEEPSP